MSELWDLARSVAARVSIHLVGARFLETVLTLVAFVVVVELLTRRRWARYRTRTFMTDATYFLFFAAGVYAFFISGPIHRLIQAGVREHGGFLLLNLASGLPAAPKALFFIMSIDCVEYWMHRLGLPLRHRQRRPHPAGGLRPARGQGPRLVRAPVLLPLLPGGAQPALGRGPRAAACGGSRSLSPRPSPR